MRESFDNRQRDTKTTTVVLGRWTPLSPDAVKDGTSLAEDAQSCVFYRILFRKPKFMIHKPKAGVLDEVIFRLMHRTRLGNYTAAYLALLGMILESCLRFYRSPLTAISGFYLSRSKSFDCAEPGSAVPSG